MYSNISEAYSYNLWTNFGTTEAQTLMKRAKLSGKAILIFNQTAGAKKKKIHTLVEEACPDSSMRTLSFGILQKASKFSISVQPFKDKLAAAILEIVLTAVTADWLALQENGIVVPSFSRF